MVPRFHCAYPWVKCQCKHKEKPTFDGTQLRISFHMNNTILNITIAKINITSQLDCTGLF